MKRRLKINGFIMAIVILSALFFPAIFFRKTHNDLSEGLTEIMGISLILLGQLLRASGRGYKSEHSGNGHSLIRGGPYALVRNPMYLGILLVGLGIVVALFKWWVLCVFLLVFIIRYILLIFKEERKLAGAFPEIYQDYRRSVPRIIPSISMLSKSDIAGYLPLKLAWLKKEIGSILAVLFITLLLESWEDIKKEGIRAYFYEGLGILSVIILFACLVAYLIRRTKNGIPDKS